MEKSGSQKVLKVISIIEIVFGALALIAGLAAFTGASMLGMAGQEQLAENGIDAATQTQGMAALNLVAMVIVVSAIISIIEGILGVRAANDPTKIQPVWILAIIALVCSVASAIMGIAHVAGATFDPSSLITIAIDAALFWVANNIKNQAALEE